MDRNKKFYEDWADKEHFSHETYMESVQIAKTEVIKKIVKDSTELSINSLLDVGSSTGVMLSELGNFFKAKYLFGVDLSSKTIEKAKSYYKNDDRFTFQVTDGTPEALNKVLVDYCSANNLKKIDMVVMVDFLEHVAEPLRYINAVKKMARLFLIKIPIEKNIWENLIMAPLGKKAVPGNGHPDGHMWELGYGQGRAFIEGLGLVPIGEFYWKHPDIVQYADHIVTSWNQKPFLKKALCHTMRATHSAIKNIFPPSITLRLIGGSYFSLATVNETEEQFYG